MEDDLVQQLRDAIEGKPPAPPPEVEEPPIPGRTLHPQVVDVTLQTYDGAVLQWASESLDIHRATIVVRVQFTTSGAQTMQEFMAALVMAADHSRVVASLASGHDVSPPQQHGHLYGPHTYLQFNAAISGLQLHALKTKNSHEKMTWWTETVAGMLRQIVGFMQDGFEDPTHDWTTDPRIHVVNPYPLPEMPSLSQWWNSSPKVGADNALTMEMMKKVYDQIGAQAQPSYDDHAVHQLMHLQQMWNEANSKAAEQITFMGTPLVFDPTVPPNMVYLNTPSLPEKELLELLNKMQDLDPSSPSGEKEDPCPSPITNVGTAENL